MTDATPTPEPTPPPAPANRLPWILGGIALLAAVVILIIVATSGDDSSDVATDGDNGAQEDSGATPEQIRAGQTALTAVGCYTGPIDGLYGPATDTAIRDFQSASGLAVDGVFGPATLAALEDAVASGTTVCTPGEDTPEVIEPVLQDTESPAGGTVKQLVVPGPETSVLVACDQSGFQPFFFTDQGSWVGCESDGAEAGPGSGMTEPVMSDVESPAGGTVKQVTIPGPETSVLLACAADGFEPFLFTDQGTWIGCQSQ